VKNEELETCPFCEQGITTRDTKAVIDAYIGYFEAEEEKHKSELRNFNAGLKRKEELLAQTETQLALQKSHYNNLKRHLPSKMDTNLIESEKSIKSAREAIAAAKRKIEQKIGALSAAHIPPEENLVKHFTDLNGIIEKNNALVDALNTAIGKSDGERKSNQRHACSAFESEFTVENWAKIAELKILRDAASTRTSELSTLEKSSPSTDARSRVANTFELLLREFFSEKYIFDKTSFTLKRGDHEMVRGPHRTMSDGEKTAIAFCYFVASIHRKVTTNSDYRRLFLVFDDPVTSMSYDFVFTIAQTLKNLNISDKGEVSVNPGLIDGGKHARPQLLVLTHSSYFFNISLTNKVVKSDAAFSLYPEKGEHKVACLKKYQSPFGAQLKDIYEISLGLREPDHATGNTIRSVLEAIGRFCRPDKSASLSDFIQYLAGEDGIAVKSVLINSLSHGTYYEEAPPPDDLILACSETLIVVEKYAAGQLEILKARR
jgi:wobble nucleotide-excising tRNase